VFPGQQLARAKSDDTEFSSILQRRRIVFDSANSQGSPRCAAARFNVSRGITVCVISHMEKAMLLEDLDTTIAPAATATSVVNAGIFVLAVRVGVVIVALM
jgi:hypothetical protein